MQVGKCTYMHINLKHEHIDRCSLTHGPPFHQSVHAVVSNCD